ncbi:MAG: helix-turn-helix domain-containing protein [Actinobacteria bacterium]|nr:helix-turn-helix domain-containing protein [Actinomycetota bacterium]
MSRPALNPTEFASTVTAISSAFGDPTRRDIFLAVHDAADGLTAAEVAGAFGLHVNVARHHLDKLAAGGYVEVVVGRAAGRTGAGRPSKRYRATEADLTPHVDVRHDAVLVNLLKRALTLLPREQAERLAEEVGEEYGREMASSMGDIAESQRSFRAALHVVADAMTAHGFAARVDELRIVAEHCPFGGADVVHPVICAVDRGMIRGMMTALHGAGDPVLGGSLLAGDIACDFEVAAAD